MPRRDEAGGAAPQQKPPLLLRIFLCLYAMLWLTLIFAAGLNSLYLGRIDYATCGAALGMTLGIGLILRYLPRYLQR